MGGGINNPLAQPRKNKEGGLMERKLRDTTTMLEDAVEEVKATRKNKGYANFKRFTGKDDLPPAKTEIKDLGNGKKKFIKIKNGEPRYFTERCEGGAIKLLKVFSTGKGTAQRHVHTLHPRKKNDRGLADRLIIKKLTAAGIM